MAHTAVQKLIPPRLSSKTIAQKIVSTRPMREGKFNISLQRHGIKRIVHCYGHGGSGWATLFGSVEKAIKLFEESHPDKKTPVRIIGSGCMGLTSAIELSRRGYQIAGITTKSLYNITSWDAGGYFALVSIKTANDEQLDLNEIGMRSFLMYQQIEQGKHPYLSSQAVRYMPVYCHQDTETGIEDLERRGLIPPREEVVLDFGNGVRHPHFSKYMTYFMNVTQLMKELLEEVKKRKIPITLQEVGHFDEIREENIFNCTGLGSRTLNRDEALIPVRGHLVTLHTEAGSGHMEYMIYTSVMQEGKAEYIYLFPKDLIVSANEITGAPCSGVLGGTFIEHADRLSPAEMKKLDEAEFKRLLDRHSLFFYGKLFT